MRAGDDQADDLLEWHPGLPEAARPGVAGALVWGARRASRSRLLIILLWGLDLLLVQRAAPLLLQPLRSWEAWRASGEPLPAALAAALELPAAPAPWPVGVRALVAAGVEAPIWAPDPFFVLFYGVLAGGIIAWLHAPRPAALVAQLGAGSGVYAPRLLRLLLIAALVWWALLRLGGIVAEIAGGRLGGLEPLVLWLTLGLVATTFDYARVRTIARDSRSMLLEAWRSARFVVRHLPRTVALQLVLWAAGGLLGLAVAGLLSLAGPATPAALVIGQLWVVGRIWIRLTMWGAMLSLYQGIALQRWSRRQAS